MVQQPKGFFGSFSVEDVNDAFFFPKRESLTTHPRYVASQKSKDLEITSVYSGKQTRNKNKNTLRTIGAEECNDNAGGT